MIGRQKRHEQLVSIKTEPRIAILLLEMALILALVRADLPVKICVSMRLEKVPVIERAKRYRTRSPFISKKGTSKAQRTRLLAGSGTISR